MTNPAYTSLLEQIRSAERRMNDLRDQLSSDTRQALKLGIEDFFQTHPNLVRFCWSQHVESEYDDEGGTYARTEVWPIWIETSAEGWLFDEYEGDGDLDEVADLEAELAEFINLWDQDLMLRFFGDYNCVSATRQGVDIHDLSYAQQLRRDYLSQQKDNR